MTLPTRVDYSEMMLRLNSALTPYRDDICGLYLMDLPYRAAELAFFLDGWLWGLRADNMGHFCYVKNRYSRVISEDLLDFVNHNTPECSDILLFVLPNPAIILDQDFPCRK